MMNPDVLSDEPTPYQNELIANFHTHCLKAEAQKKQAAKALSVLPKPMRCVYTQRGTLVATFRYLDESDYQAFPHVRGFYNALVVRTDKEPYLDRVLNFSAQR